MSLLTATARVAGAGTTPVDGIQKRAQRALEKKVRQEQRYVQQFKDRIDLEVHSQESMDMHLTQAMRQIGEKQARAVAFNDLKYARADQAASWRMYCAAEKLERCSASVAGKNQRIEDMRNWRNRVLYDLPQQLLLNQKKALAASRSDTDIAITKHLKNRLG
mmetsp:Transcript_54128/g.128885  ORF Transcript_54128/g.128885 Transcript_54128/m.128885 type:complete len:162 (-) Transcript_54128:254-739(-)